MTDDETFVRALTVVLPDTTDAQFKLFYRERRRPVDRKHHAVFERSERRRWTALQKTINKQPQNPEVELMWRLNWVNESISTFRDRLYKYREDDPTGSCSEYREFTDGDELYNCDWDEEAWCTLELRRALAWKEELEERLKAV